MRWATDDVRRHNQESEDDTDPDSMDDAHSSESSEGGGSMHSANDRHNEWAMGWAAVAAADSESQMVLKPPILNKCCDRPSDVELVS